MPLLLFALFTRHRGAVVAPGCCHPTALTHPQMPIPPQGPRSWSIPTCGPHPDAVFSSLFLSPRLAPSPPGREGRMVVLSLVLGLSEQDDFANIPDLQPAGTQPNQPNAQGDKR